MKKRADLLLVEQNLAESISKAQAMIMAGQVSIEGKIIKKYGETYSSDSNIKISDLHRQWVSRGALKLLHALKIFNTEVKDYVCLDIGSSTGGFSEVLLKNDAKKIYSVDVGKNQLHEKLKKEKKIINIEKTNARYLNKKIIPENIDLIVCDVSFISMKKVLEPSLALLNNKTGTIIGLIKPQFEASRHEIKKGGIISEELIHTRICKEFENWFITKCKMKVLGITQSPIKGSKGNIEFFIGAKINL